MKQRRIRCLAAAAFVLLFLGAAWFTGCDLSLMWSRRDHLTDIAAKMFPPDWGFLGKVLPLLWATIQMSITGTFLGAVLSIPAAMACAAALPGPGPVKKAVRFCIQVLRSFPALILALLATFFLGIGSFAGTAAITVYTFAIMTRLTYEDIESAPQGPYLALRAMGAASAQAFFRSTLPEILPAYLTNALYLLEGNVRHSAILGYVGAGGIGLLLNEKVSWREYDKVGTILLLLFAVVYLMEHLSTWLTRLVQQERTLGRQERRLLHGHASAARPFPHKHADGEDALHRPPAPELGAVFPPGQQRTCLSPAGDRCHRAGGDLRRRRLFRSSGVSRQQPLFPGPRRLAVPDTGDRHPVRSLPDLWTDLHPRLRPRLLYRSADPGSVQRGTSLQALHRGHRHLGFSGVSRSGGHGDAEAVLRPSRGPAAAGASVLLRLALSV